MKRRQRSRERQESGETRRSGFSAFNEQGSRRAAGAGRADDGSQARADDDSESGEMAAQAKKGACRRQEVDGRC